MVILIALLSVIVFTDMIGNIKHNVIPCVIYFKVESKFLSLKFFNFWLLNNIMSFSTW